VVGFAVASALTLLPAVLTIVGPGSIGWRSEVGADLERRWAHLARWVMADPGVIVPTLAVIPRSSDLRSSTFFNAPDSSILPSSTPSRAGSTDFGPHSATAFAPIVLAIRTTGRSPRSRTSGLYEYSRRLAADERVTRVGPRRHRSPVDARAIPPALRQSGGPPDRYALTTLTATTRGDLTAFTVYTPLSGNREEGKALVAAMRDPSGRSPCRQGPDRPGRRWGGRT
jgi:hypothetical protein